MPVTTPATVPAQVPATAPERASLAGLQTGLRRRLLLASALLSACTWQADADHAGDDAPAAAPLPRRPRIAWAFSSGGPRGFVHVGVLKALDEIGVRPDVIIGASVGALFAVLRAGGMDGRAIESLVLETHPLTLLRLAGTGLSSSERFSGESIGELVREQLLALGQTPRLERLPLMVACVAQRLSDGAVVPFTQGDAGVAVQAACSIEGRFAPVRIRGEPHVDADQHLPLPVRLVRSLGASRVLAVDASAHEERAPAGAERWRDIDLRKRALTRPDALDADVMLHPDIGYYAGLSRAYREHCIRIGHRATMAAASEIRAMHAP